MVALTRRAAARTLPRLALALVILLAWTLPRAADRSARAYPTLAKQHYSSLTGTIDYVQQINSSGKSSHGGVSHNSFTNHLHTMHVVVKALYSDKIGGYLARVTETIANHDGDLTVTPIKVECNGVKHTYIQKLGTDETETGSYTGDAGVELDIQILESLTHDLAHPVFVDPYQIELKFASDTFPGKDRHQDIDVESNPCLQTNPHGWVQTSQPAESHYFPIAIEGHPNRNPNSARLLTGKITQNDDGIADGEHGTATTTVTWRLHYCEMDSVLAPLAPMTC